MTYRKFIFLLITVTIIWFASGYFLYSLPERGTIGDMFGAINALFSGFAFAGLIYTILLQREELLLTRNELEGQKVQLEAQSNELKIQNFENKFFQLIKLINDTVNAIDLIGTNKITKGRDCITIFYTRLQDYYFFSNGTGMQAGTTPLSSNEKILSFFKRNENELGHYFRLLKSTLKFIDTSDLESKSFYFELIKSQLSEQETLMLFYYAINDVEMKKIIEQHQIFENIAIEKLMNKDTDSRFYNQSAYTRS